MIGESINDFVFIIPISQMSKIIRSLMPRPPTCLFNEINTWKKRIACTGLATVVTMGCFYGGYVYLQTCSRSDPSIKKCEDTFDSVVGPIFNAICDLEPRFHPIIPPIFLATISAFVAGVYIDQSIKFVHLIKNNTKCCNIIRGTSKYIILTPVAIFTSEVYGATALDKWDYYTKTSKKLTE